MRAALILLLLSGCARIQDLQTPQLSPPRAELAEDLARTEAPVSASSTYGARSTLFADRIAKRAGDVLTVSIRIDDRARLANGSNRSRTIGRGFSAAGTGRVGSLVKAINGDAAVDSATDFDGKGGTNRSESIRLSVAAIVVERLPGGNLVIEGTQEVRVNAELRVLKVSGIVRPVDLGTGNVVSYERLAEARISYGGRGPIAEVQQPPWGQRLFDAVSPF